MARCLWANSLWTDPHGGTWGTRAMLHTCVGSWWPSSPLPSRSEFYALAHSGVVPLVRYPIGCGSFTGYDGQWLACVQSAVPAVASYINSVAQWREEQGHWMRAHSGSARA
jgi:hypothetical protein